LTDLFVKKEDARTKIFSVSGSLIIYQLPAEVDLGYMKFSRGNDNRLWLTDEGLQFRMDISETDHILPHSE
jgi:hypothetical protein